MKPLLILLKHVVKLVTSCLIITAALCQVELKSGRKQFPEIFVDWFNKFQDIYRFNRDNKLRQFCFRFLYRTVAKKRELKLFRLADNDKCIY